MYRIATENFAKLGSAIALVVALFFTSAAVAVPVYGTAADATGSRNTDAGGGLEFVRGSPSGTLTISWDITDNMDGTWDYKYTFTHLNLSNPSISHLTLDVSDDCITLNDADCVTNAKINNQAIQAISLGDLDGIIGAVKFDVGAEIGSGLMYSFTSNRAPVWGDVFIKEGLWDAANLGFGDRTSMDTNLYIARPNGMRMDMPAPGTLALLGFGLIGTAFVARQRKRSSTRP